MRRDPLDTVRYALGERGDHDPDTPPFGRVWRAALERRDSRRLGRRLRRAAAALAAVAALVLVLKPAPEPPAEIPPETLELARSLAEWQGPLDFLLEPPGGSLFRFEPRPTALGSPGELSSTIEIEEIL